MNTLRKNGTVFGVVMGFVAGLLVAALVVPKRQPETNSVTTGRQAGSATGTADAALANGASAGDGGGQPGVGTLNGGSGGTGGAGAAGSAGGALSGEGAAAGPAGSSQGVTDDKVTVVVTYPDISALRALGPAYDNGDVPEQWRVMIDGWRRDGLLPVNGRDIDLKFRTYNVLNTDEQRAACRGAVSDDKAFAVVGVAYFEIGGECVAREFRTPLITSDGPNEDIFARSHPMLFSLSASKSRHLRNFVNWAHHRGTLQGKKIGIYYLDDGVTQDLMNKTIRAELSRLGYGIAAEHSTTQSLGGPQDAVAVQRFRSAGVDLALLFTSKAGFLQAANAQGYKPLYLESDYEFGTSDTTTSNYPADAFDGTLGMTGRRVGETPAGVALGADGDACIANFEQATGKKTTPETAVWSYILMGCDEGKVLLHGLQAAGRNLTHESWIAGVETMSNVPLTRYAPVTFTPDKHDGGEQQRSVQWSAGCECWLAQGAFEPMWVR